MTKQRRLGIRGYVKNYLKENEDPAKNLNHSFLVQYMLCDHLGGISEGGEKRSEKFYNQRLIGKVSLLDRLWLFLLATTRVAGADDFAGPVAADGASNLEVGGKSET